METLALIILGLLGLAFFATIVALAAISVGASPEAVEAIRVLGELPKVLSQIVRKTKAPILPDQMRSAPLVGGT